MDNRFIRVDEVAAELDVSKPYAYNLPQICRHVPGGYELHFFQY